MMIKKVLKRNFLIKKTISDKFGVTDEFFHKDLKKKIVKEHDKIAKEKIGSDNPNVLISGEDNIILEHPDTKKRVNTGTSASKYRKK